MPLAQYQRKRKFHLTPEPEGEVGKSGEKLAFVVQRHQATRLHFDLRLEMEGVLKSWAVPKGPPLTSGEKRLAVMVEDHPLEYAQFEGTIPAGEYGAGQVEIWDRGEYGPAYPTDNPQQALLKDLQAGELKLVFAGSKLKGEYALVRFGKEKKNWLLLKAKGEGKTLESVSSPADPAGKPAPFPHAVKPMLAQLVDKPFDDPDWLYEVKWDGYRALAEIDRGKVRLYSRNNQSFNDAYPVIVEALAKIKHGCVLDGEIVALNDKGQSQFQLLQDYRRNPEVTLVYYVFDLLYLDGRDLRSLPLVERKARLKDILPEGPHLKYSDHIEKEGTKLLELAKKKNVEGVMAKKKTSPYLPRRTGLWLKFKNVLMTEAVIAGYTAPRGSREEFGALILGVYDQGKLVYIGHTGTGFDTAKLKELRERFRPLETKESPFAMPPKTNMPVTWLKPKLVAQVKFTEWTRERSLRHPVFLGLRADKKAREVTFDSKAK